MDEVKQKMTNPPPSEPRNINTQIFQTLKMSGVKVGQINMCDSCTKDKKIFFIGKLKQDNRPERTTFLCNDCFNNQCFCTICWKKTTYSSYERHLIDKHTNKQMANQQLNEKVHSDHF